MKRLVLIEGGLHKVYQQIYYALNNEFDLEIITSPNNKLMGVRIKKLKKVKLLSKSFSYYRGIYSYLKKRNFDIISVRPYYRIYSFIAMIYAILNKKKFIIMEEQRNNPHSILENLFFQLWLLIIQPIVNLKAHRIICITKPCYEYMKKKGFKKLIYIPVPYKPKRFPKKINNTDKQLKIITVARFDWLKAHNVLIEAIDYLIKNNKIDRKMIKVTLIGKGGKLETNTRNLIKKHRLEDIFNFEGYVDNKKIDKHYQKHNLFVLPSRSEPVGMVVFEAMSNGLPLIVSSNTGAKCSVYYNKNGYIFESENHKDLAEKILLMKNPKKRQRFGEESIKILKERHNPEKIKEMYLNVLKND